MQGTEPTDSAVDLLDRQLIQAVQLAARAPYTLLASVLGVSEQTAARRWRRLESAGVVRVLGLPRRRTADTESWMLRIHCRPAAAGRLADALAARPDVNWVSLAAGGSEVLCSARTRPGSAGQELLLQRLPRTAEVLDLNAYAVLHRFDSDAEWAGFGGELSRAQTTRLLDGRVPAASDSWIQDSDGELLAALARDGRTSLQTLALRTGWSPARVSRRIEQLTGSGALHFDVDLDLRRLGYTSLSNIWLTVAPGDLEAVGRALSRHPEVAYCVAITGPANLVTAVVCRDSADLYRYVATRVGALPAVRGVEISPLLRRVKQAGTLLTDRGIAHPAAPVGL